jgi:hypothetical protein
MPTNSKSKKLTAVALALGLAAVVGPLVLSSHGLAHDVISTLTSLLTLFAGTALVIFATETESCRTAPQGKSDAQVDQRSMPAIGGTEDTVLMLLRWPALSLNTIISRKKLLLCKSIFFALAVPFALLSLVGVYEESTFFTWSDCLLQFSIALCFGLSVILQLAEEARRSPNNDRSLPSEQSPNPLSRQEASEKFTALITLFTCQAFLWLSIVWFEKAVKNGHFGQWWSFVCFTGASLCFATIFVRGSLRAAREKRERDNIARYNDLPTGKTSL